MTAHIALRDFTRSAHDRLDSRFSSLNLGDEGDYSLFLRAHAAAFLPVEQALERGGAATILTDWHDIKRSPALLSDLQAMNLNLPTPEVAPDYETAADLLGGIYVLEGSRLGGKLLRKATAERFPAQFLTSEVPSGHWRMFLSMMNEQILSEADRAAAQNAALRTFLCFDRAAERVLGG